MNNPTLFRPDGEPVLNAWERCNEVWKTIAKDRGVEMKSITPASNQDPMFFEATPLTQEKEQTDDPSKVH